MLVVLSGLCACSSDGRVRHIREWRTSAVVIVTVYIIASAIIIGCVTASYGIYDTTLHIIHYTSYIIHHTSYIIHHTAYIIHRTSYIIHHTSYIIHHTSYIIHHTYRSIFRIRTIIIVITVISNGDTRVLVYHTNRSGLCIRIGLGCVGGGRVAVVGGMCVCVLSVCVVYVCMCVCGCVLCFCV